MSSCFVVLLVVWERYLLERIKGSLPAGSGSLVVVIEGSALPLSHWATHSLRNELFGGDVVKGVLEVST